MKWILAAILSLSIALSSVSAQPTLQNAATDAFLVYRMAEKFHIQPRPADEQLSADWFDELLESLDGQRILFTQEDLNLLLPYRLRLIDCCRSHDTKFLQLLSTLYQTKLRLSDSVIASICKTAFKFDGNGFLTLAEDSTRPANLAAMNKKAYKLLASAVLDGMIDYADNADAPILLRRKKSVDSLEALVRKKVALSSARGFTRILQQPGGIEGEVATAYCKALALCYDPHTEYFPQTEKENFEASLGASPMRFGFRLSEDDEGNAIIENLKPGSAAFKTGLLNKGDKIQTLQWAGKDAIDVMGAGALEVSELLGDNNHSQLTMTVKKNDGSIRQVTLSKEKADASQEERVQSFVLKGAKNIGYIALPAFYTDWADDAQSARGCAEDVASEILKLKRENISALVLDLRFNGGGSMEEATDLAGLFIDGGPVQQVKTRAEKIATLKDINRGSIFDGPLAVLVNGYSASASEMVAGTLQDYHRALIMGSPTYGKATTQVILPLDTNANPESGNMGKAGSFLKITTGKLYRITGVSAQQKGVSPDIMIPDLTVADPQRESNAKHAIPNSNIEANKYYHAYPPLALQELLPLAKTFSDTAKSLQLLRTAIQSAGTARLQDKPLNLATVLAGQSGIAVTDAENAFLPTSMYVATATRFKQTLSATDEDFKAALESAKSRLQQDPAIQLAYLLMSKTIK